MTIKEAVEFYNHHMEHMKLLDKLENELLVALNSFADEARITLKKKEGQELLDLVRVESCLLEKELNSVFKESV